MAIVGRQTEYFVRLGYEIDLYQESPYFEGMVSRNFDSLMEVLIKMYRIFRR